MKYIDPLPASCAACGHRGAYAVAELLALRARCAACGLVLEANGRALRRSANESDEIVMQWNALIALERRLGREIATTDLPDASPRSLLAAVAAELGCGAGELVEPFEAVLAELLARDVREGDFERGFLELFAAYPEEVPAMRAARRAGLPVRDGAP